MLETSSLADRITPGGHKKKLVKLHRGDWPRNSQFTNLRMRTFIATPSARNVNNTEDPP